MNKPVLAAEISLTWNASTSSNIDYYYIYFRTYEENDYRKSINVGNKLSYTVPGLTEGTRYCFVTTAVDRNGNESTYSNEVCMENHTSTPPTTLTISGVSSSSITTNSAVISWTTNVASDTQVEYGTSASYGTSTTLNLNKATSHSQTLSNLKSNTRYYYRVRSKSTTANLTMVTGSFTTTAMTISSVSSSNITINSATISWTTNVALDTQVEYGTSTSYDASTTLNSSKVTAHSQTLNNLKSNTTYYYRVRSKDSAENLAISTGSFKTAALTVSNVKSTGITINSAIISWTTNVALDTQVEYGTSTNYNKSTTLNSSKVTSHSQTLSNLNSNTKYYYRVRSTDATVNQVAATGSFTTAAPASAPDPTPAPTPDTTQLTVSNVKSTVTANSATISWTTNVALDTQVEYGTSTNYDASTTLNSSKVTAHSQTLSSLNSNTKYYYRVKSTDAKGNQVTATGSFTTSKLTSAPDPDTATPIISRVTSTDVKAYSATISWTTSIASDTQVEYGTTTAYGQSTSLNSVMATAHEQILSGLTRETTYHYRVKSRSAAGNQSVSENYSFTTITPVEDTTPPVISGVTSTGVTTTGAVIEWRTNKDSDTQVEYGTTTAYGKITTLNSRLGTAHKQIIDGLTANTLYHYRVKSKDKSGNLAMSTDYTFITEAAGVFEFALPLFASSQNTLGDGTMVGLELLNQGVYSVPVYIRAMDDEGSMIEGNGITNPITRTLPPQTQIALLDFQVLGDDWINAQVNGWMRLNTASEAVSSLFMVFDDEQSFIESVRPADTLLYDFIFTDIEPEGYNKLSFINSNSEASEIIVDLVKENGGIRDSVQFPISAKGMIIADLYDDLFTEMTPKVTDYIRVRTPQGIRPFDFLRRGYGDLAILDGQDSSVGAGSTIMYAPNYVHNNSTSTSLSVINMSPVAGTVHLRLIGDDGIQLGMEQSVVLPAAGKLHIKDPAFFMTSDQGNAVSGYVEIISDGPMLSGSILYGDRSRQASYTAMPLISNLDTSTLFNHVASNDMYSSRIVVVNPGAEETTVTASLYAANGTMLESSQAVVPSKGRLAKGIKEYFATLVNEAQMEGYIKLTSSNPTTAYMEVSISTALAVIPPQAIMSEKNDKIKQKSQTVVDSYFDALVKYLTTKKK